ncbi:hypothetical protein BCU94_15330 [Shewanella sp. 10N.286.52.C2]|nr:hypothetical protein BCU94_15330 [Shewanella sp. 10N.286.52.C2]PMG40467.1 hypothetical protein BCU91_12770 [Shewanella sp. 10N.286.52.B9]PMH87958.1 hypothetical protein BCU57_04950 [Shewanella sp. 10N.286.48.B5]
MGSIHNYYLVGFMLLSAILNAFIENESIGIKLLCLLLLFTTFIFASLFHSLKVKVAKEKTTNKAHIIS